MAMSPPPHPSRSPRRNRPQKRLYDSLNNRLLLSTYTQKSGDGKEISPPLIIRSLEKNFRKHHSTAVNRAWPVPRRSWRISGGRSLCSTSIHKINSSIGGKIICLTCGPAASAALFANVATALFMVSCVITCNASIFPLQLLKQGQGRWRWKSRRTGPKCREERRERREKSFEFWSLLI